MQLSMCSCYLVWKCASRHNGVHFFDISTPKSGPHLVCFVHFDLQMCFAPQRRALFRHLNFQKCSETQVFCTFSLGNVLRATTACNFSSLNWPAGSATAELAQRIWLKPGETVGISEIPNAVGKKLVFRGGSTGCACVGLHLRHLWFQPLVTCKL